MKLFAWRKVLWIYRSAPGGWCVYIFQRGFHVQALDGIEDDQDWRDVLEPIKYEPWGGIDRNPSPFWRNHIVMRGDDVG